MYTSEVLARGRDLARAGLRLQSPPSTASPLGTTAAAVLSSRQQRMERKGHTKSRRGCFNCKRRRIKCQETRPACGHCIKTGLNCEYPVVPQVVHQPQHQIPIFSLQDMRLFQHFLLQCYPHYPIGSENIWTHEIPCLSQKYEYLMHAILGFAASELLNTDPSLIESAMTHRLKAIRAIKKTLNAAAASSAIINHNDKDKTFEEGNALMATCFALTFQSVWLDDGMTEYMTFIRGIVIVGYQMYMRGSKFLFGAHLGDKQTEALEPFMKQVPLINKSWAEGAVRAIEGLRELPTPPPPPPTNSHLLTPEQKYHELILDMANKCLVSSWEAYKALTAHYAWWMMLPHDQFERLMDPSNQVALLLATHWIALKQVMAPITEVEKRGFAKVPDSWKDSSSSSSSHSSAGQGKEKKAEEDKHDMDVGIIRWLRFLNKSVGREYARYNQWPGWVEEELVKDLGVFGRGSVKCC
ncbi:C6 zinc finger protein [Rhypophila decipiens]|uniref:C6 zinc finger protein n=1 Tax=Rhypophila decipiens TaxID=261697 RepID=A0AAN7B9Y8_9PEZI|nr:C6 zinc finger protein [Rhypophila decipiens]